MKLIEISDECYEAMGRYMSAERAPMLRFFTFVFDGDAKNFWRTSQRMFFSDALQHAFTVARMRGAKTVDLAE